MLCGVSRRDLEDTEINVESRNMSPEEEAKELARFLREDDFYRR